MYYIMSDFVPDFSRPQELKLGLYQRVDYQPQCLNNLAHFEYENASNYYYKRF